MLDKDKNVSYTAGWESQDSRQNSLSVKTLTLCLSLCSAAPPPLLPSQQNKGEGFTPLRFSSPLAQQNKSRQFPFDHRVGDSKIGMRELVHSKETA